MEGFHRGLKSLKRDLRARTDFVLNRMEHDMPVVNRRKKKKIVEAHIAIDTIQNVIPTKSEPLKKL